MKKTGAERPLSKLQESPDRSGAADSSARGDTLARNERLYRFLDHLGQATMGARDPDEVLAVTTRMTAQHLGLSNCAYADMDPDEDGFTIRGNWHAPGSPSIVGHYQLADFGRLAVQELSAGRPLIINDNLLEIAPEEAKTFQDIGIAATICMPLVKEGRLTALMAIHDREPHRWSDYELTVIREVTERSWAHVERVRSEAELRQLNEDLERLVAERTLGRSRTWELSPDLMSVLNAEGRFEALNPAWTRVLGWSEAELRRFVFFDLIHPDDIERTSAAWRDCIDHGLPAIHFENRYRTKSGEWRWLSWVAVPEDGKVYSSTRDVTEAKLQADVLAQRTAERDRLWRLSQDLLLISRRGGEIVAVNPAWTKLLGYNEQELIGADIRSFIHPDDLTATVAEAARITLAGEGMKNFTNRYRAKDGRWVCLAWSVTFEAGLFHGVARDMTAERAAQAELEAAQEQLVQIQKLESMGQLTGGVAHDFNNLLTPIIGGLDLLQRRAVGGEREQRLIAGALQSAERAKLLVQRLLAFARRQPLQTRPVDVSELIAGLADLIATTVGPQIRVKAEVGADLPYALGDLNQLEMALLNLGVNARDAMPDGGVLRITASREAVETARGELAPGAYVRISVADSGTGMDPETLARAVEPFFSTKGLGKGTGLGLSMVHGLVSQLGGALVINSEVGVGTHVELWLPESESGPACPLSEAPAADERSAAGTVLLVDDEDAVRLAAADMLQDFGYDVVEAASGAEAVRLLRQREDFALVVTDHLMPGITGVEVASEVGNLRPGTPVLIISGYAELEGIDPSLARLSKPFRREDLAQALAELQLPAGLPG